MEQAAGETCRFSLEGSPMNQEQKERIIALRGGGETCAHIAGQLGISVNTVKSFCRRNGIQPKIPSHPVIIAVDSGVNCPQCGNKIKPTSGRKPKRFCSDACRVLWWNSHSEQVKRKAVYSFKCDYCGRDFTAYGNTKRRYCSHTCYCADRFGNCPADSRATV
jgi:endogenous inhibitor of DNA gyrase (YacG/DUF329 family)